LMATKRKAADDVAPEESRKQSKNEPAAAAASAEGMKCEVVGGAQRIKCPFLDTINRKRLDFDLAKECSVTLVKKNIYCCLVCGKYFGGRGKRTHAYTHSVEKSHHVFVNLETGKFYCLPDLYEIVDQSLGDIQRALDPQFAGSQVANLDSEAVLRKDVFGVSYLPGNVGLNNLKMTDYVNVVLQALCHVKPLRNFFLSPSNYSTCTSPLVLRFGEFIRKFWSPHNFKNCVAPHDFVNEVSTTSKKRFVAGKQSLCTNFLSWLLNQLHVGLHGTRKRGSSIIHKCFQGVVETKETQLLGDVEKEQHPDAKFEEGKDVTITKTPFLFLSLDLLRIPQFKDNEGGNIIPQVPLFNVLDKFNGEQFTDIVLKKVRRRYKILELPKYLILNVKRFKSNGWFTEKNSTIVNIPIKNLEMSAYVEKPKKALPTPDELRAMPVKSIKKLLKNLDDCLKQHVDRYTLRSNQRMNLLAPFHTTYIATVRFQSR